MDFIQGIPNGTMMIRDLGGWVEFWFQTSSATWNSDQPWGYDAGAGYYQGTFNLQRGGGWQRAGSVFVDTRRNVMFRMIGSGLGWGTTDFTVFIERASIPPPPFPPHIFGVGSTWIDVGWGGEPGGGGATITGREFWHSHDNTPRVLVANGGVRFTLTGLNPGSWYKFWAKSANFLGWSAFSPPVAARTLRVPDAPNPVTVKDVDLGVATASFTFTGRWDGGTPIRQWQIGYGTGSVPTLFVSGNNVRISNLTPGRVNYFWARARNDIGWGAWSGRSQVSLPAGGKILYGGVMKPAVAYVKYNGVWRPARPYAKLYGMWKTTS